MKLRSVYYQEVSVEIWELKRMDNIMEVIALSPYPRSGPSARYRVFEYANKMRKEQIQMFVDEFLDDKLYKKKTEKKLSNTNLYIYVARRIIDRFILIRIKKRRGIFYIHRQAVPIAHRILDHFILSKKNRYIFDMDDAVFTEYPIEHLLRRCSAVTVGNQYLANYVTHVAPGVPVTIVPTTVDTTIWTVVERIRVENLVVGWIGTGSTFHRYLQPVLADLVRVSREHGAEFRVIAGHDVKAAAEAAGAVFVPWSLETEVRDVQAFDVGVMPLHDDEYVRGKCAFKLIQYGAVGIPSVGTDIGANGEVVQHGVTGYLTSSAADMVERVAELLKDPVLREQMGLAARQVVEQKFSLESQVPVLADVFRRVAEEAQRVRH